MARRLKLREFHEMVVAKLTSLADTETAHVSSRLGIEAGGDHWLVDLASASEVAVLPAYVPVPLTRPWFLGVSNVRGNLYGIVDFSQFLGAAPTQRSAENRVVFAHPRYRVNAGLLVARVVGLRNIAELERQPPEEGAAPWISARLAEPAGKVWKELNLPALLNYPDFLSVALYQRRSVFAHVAPEHG